MSFDALMGKLGTYQWPGTIRTMKEEENGRGKLSRRLTNIAVSEYRSLYQPTVPDRLDSRRSREDGR